jgi:hypothetical protein
MLAAASAAGAETAREMLDHAKEVNDARRPKDVTQKFTMTLVDSRGSKRVRDLVTYAKEYGARETRTITFFQSPSEVKGVGFLAWSYPNRDDDQWLYLPALKRVRQITANTRRQSFQGSDFSYEDLQLFDDIRDWTEEDAASALIKENETIDGMPCAVIEVRPKEKEIQYSRFILWLDRKESTFRKIEFYDVKDDALLKVLGFGDWKTVDGVPTPHRLEMVNSKKGTRTLMEFAEVRYNQGLADEIFTQRYLERGRVNR